MSSGNYKSGGNWGQRPVQFKLQDAERINAAVQAHERGRRGRKGSTLPRAAGGGGGDGAEIIEATFYGVWQNGSSKNVNVAVQGSFTAATTLLVYNKLGIIPPAQWAAARTCYIYKRQLSELTIEWVLLSAQV
jgi:hypothetical protein